MGDGRPTAAGVAYSHRKALRRGRARDLTTDLKRSEQTTLEVRKRRLPDGAKGSRQVADLSKS